MVMKNCEHTFKTVEKKVSQRRAGYFVTEVYAIELCTKCGFSHNYGGSFVKMTRVLL
jgi:hypothetical protein